jgi:multidrug resistance protein MdtO
MASIAQSLPVSRADYQWLGQWLREELTPYPGRGRLVARMVVAATLVMIICMTYRIPYAFQGAIIVLLISRESLRASLQSATTILLVTAIGAAYLLASVWFVINLPLLHFLWIVGSLFLAFYIISTLTNYLAAAIFAVMLSVGIPLWDRHVSAETNVEDTLWLCLATLIGVMVTAGVELALTRPRAGDEVVSQISERLSAVGNLLMCYADGAVDPATQRNLVRLGTLGTSLLRRILRRSDYSPHYRATMTGVAVLIGRLVDLAATLAQFRVELAVKDRNRFRSLASTLASIRVDLSNRAVPAPVQFDTEEQSAAVPLLGEMERIVVLIPHVFQGSRSIQEYIPPTEDSARAPLFAADALVNPEHVHFALKGCLAATGSYVIYNAIAWPAISTAVTTCLFTALSTIGASRQKQILRIAGASVGGFVLGMGSQVFILPYVDSIAGFTVLFIIATLLSAWFQTSSPRLSYFGLQMALAFYLINLQEFRIQTSLSVARDRVVGVLLGLSMMWLVFDQLWGAPAAVELRRVFVSNLRSLAQFAREPLSTDLKLATARRSALRETIEANLNKERALGDGVLFEFGPSRQRDMALRSRFRGWQPRVRALFALRIASWEYRAQTPGFALPERVRLRHQEYDAHSAQMLEEMAARIEGTAPPGGARIEESHELLNRMVEEIQGEAPAELSLDRRASLIALLRGIDSVTTSLASEIAADAGLQP